MRDVSVFSKAKAMPRMSWAPENLYNLWQRSDPKRGEITFTRTSASLFQQRWVSKAMVRAYHGDYIPEKIFKRWYLPSTLPDVRPKRKVFGDDTNKLEQFALRKKIEDEAKREEKMKGMAPVGSLMFAEVERRIDVFLFRCCFAHSVYEARRLVIHGDVMLNGKKHQNANTRLAPGDMVHVNPDAIRFLKRQNSPSSSEPEPKAIEPVLSDSPLPPSETPEVTTSTPPSRSSATPELTPFNLPTYASPWLFIPAYIEVSFLTCTGIYVRHPTARPGYSEIPTPYDADGEVMRFAWEWYAKVRPRMRSQRQFERMPEDRAMSMLEDDRPGRRRFGFR